MSELFVIRLGREPDRQVEWIVADDDGTRRSPPAAGTLEEAATQVHGRPVVVLVPATEALTTTVDLPIRGGPRLLAALPYALEEQFATDVAIRDSGRLLQLRVNPLTSGSRCWLKPAYNHGKSYPRITGSRASPVR